VVSATIVLGHPRLRGRGSAAVVLIMCAVMFVHSVRNSSSQIPLLSLPAHRDTVLGELKRQYATCNVLLVTMFPAMFLTRNRGAIFPMDWTELGPGVARWAPQFQLYAVVAASLHVPGMAENPGRLNLSGFASGPVWVAEDPAAITHFRELWRSPAPMTDCHPASSRRGVDPVDLAAARRLWEDAW
jgi:hypothetical protein